MSQPVATASYKPFEHGTCICAGFEYQYEALKAGEIRILVIEPAQPEEDIRCRLIHKLLQTQPFEALSYTWGDESSREIVHCTGKPFCVTANCASAIRRLRYPHRERHVWIDAICIDQLNILERSAQVHLMSQIYSTASRVVIYLGESADDSDMAMDYISYSGPQIANDKTTTAIQKLYERSYFERIWVIQEVAMSRLAIVLCGSKSLPWFYIVAYARNLAWQPPVLSPMTRLQHRSFMHFTTLEEFTKSLCEASLCHCRDPRDRIFAFISLVPTHMDAREVHMLKTSGFPSGDHAGTRISSSFMKEKHHVHGERIIAFGDPLSRYEAPEIDGVDRLQANYNSPAEMVFTNVAIVLLNNMGLDFLSAMQGHEATGKMPTWVPDWRVRSRRAILAHLPLSGFSAGGATYRQEFHGTRYTAPLKRTLRVCARRIGKIEYLGEVCDTGQNDWGSVVFDAWRQLAEQRSRIPAEDLPESFYKVLFMDVSDKFSKHYQALRRVCGSAHGQATGESLLSCLTPDGVARLRMVLQGRRLCVTEDGTLGVTASESDIGDLVYIVLGTKVPYIFRKRGTTLGLVGECFLQGYMQDQCAPKPRGRVEDILVA